MEIRGEPNSAFGAEGELCGMRLARLDKASRMNPYTYSTTMNATRGREKGLLDWEYGSGRNLPGKESNWHGKLLEGQHPFTVGIAATAGHWARG